MEQFGVMEFGEYGELGTGEKVTKDEPVKAIFPNGTKIIQVDAGENHSLALDENGNVWAWGRNQYYQLGNNIQEEVLTPVKVAGLANIRKIACGSYTSYAIGSMGEVYSFGLNANGEGGIRKLYKQNNCKQSERHNRSN
jgi:alpha-tubulin suppressor-like RCC1 family protein